MMTGGADGALLDEDLRGVRHPVVYRRVPLPAGVYVDRHGAQDTPESAG